MFKFPVQFSDYLEFRKNFTIKNAYNFDENLIDDTFDSIFNNLNKLWEYEIYDFIFTYIDIIQKKKDKDIFLAKALNNFDKLYPILHESYKNDKQISQKDKIEIIRIFIFLTSYLIYILNNFIRTKTNLESKKLKWSLKGGKKDEKNYLNKIKKQNEKIYELGKCILKFSLMDNYIILNNNENVTTKVIECLIDILIISKSNMTDIKRDFIEPILNIIENNKLNQTILRRNLLKNLKNNQYSNEVVICFLYRLIEKKSLIFLDFFLNFFYMLKNELLQNKIKINNKNIIFIENFFNILTLEFSNFTFKIIKDLLKIFSSNNYLIRKIGIKSITNLILKEELIENENLNKSNLDTSILISTNKFDLSILDEDKKFKKIFDNKEEDKFKYLNKNKTRKKLVQILISRIYDKSGYVRLCVIDCFITLIDSNKINIYEYYLVFEKLKSRIMDSSSLVRKKVIIFISNIFLKLNQFIKYEFNNDNIDDIINFISREIDNEESDENKLTILKMNLEVCEIYKNMITEFSKENFIFKEFLESRYNTDVISIFNLIKIMMNLKFKNSRNLLIYSFNHIHNTEKNISKKVCELFYDSFYNDSELDFIKDLETFTINFKENDIKNLEEIIKNLFNNFLNNEKPSLDLKIGETAWKYFILNFNKKKKCNPLILLLSRVASFFNKELAHLLIQTIPNILKSILSKIKDNYQDNLIIKELAIIVTDILKNYEKEILEKYDMNIYTQYFLYFIVKFQGSEIHEFYITCKIFIKLLFRNISPVGICQELIKSMNSFLISEDLDNITNKSDEIIKRKLAHLLYVVSEIMLNFKDYKFKKINDYVKLNQKDKKNDAEIENYLYSEEKIEKGKNIIIKYFRDNFTNKNNCFYKYFHFSKLILEEYLNSEEKTADNWTKICLFVYCNYLTLSDEIYKEYSDLFYKLIKINKDIIITKNLIIYCGELMCQYTQIGEEISEVLLPLLEKSNLEIKKTIFTIMSQLTLSDLLRINKYIIQFINLYFDEKMKLMIENYVLQLLNKDQKIFENNISKFINFYCLKKDYKTTQLKELKELVFFIIENVGKKKKKIIQKLICNLNNHFEKNPKYATLYIINEISKSHDIFLVCYENRECFKKIWIEPDIREIYRKLLVNLENLNSDNNMNRAMKNILENSS